MPQPGSRSDRDSTISLEAARADADRIARFRAGDAAAFDEIVTEYWGRIVRYADRMLADRDTAHDIAQDAFIRLWLRRHECTRSRAIPAFLYRATHNLVIDESRKQLTRMRGVVVRNASQDDSRRPRTPAAVLEQIALRNALDNAIGGLPARRREVFILYHFHNHSYRQIAEILGITPQVVANYMSAALKELRCVLRPLLAEQID
jgi:RNA polymerase sigma-70 factor (ECF subfamily)